MERSHIGFGHGQRRPQTAEEMREHAKSLHARADRLMDSAWGRMASIPSPLVTGSSGYSRNFGKANSRNIRSFENAGEKAKALRQAAGKWIARADRIDPLRIEQRAKDAEAKAVAKLTIEEFLCATVKPGQLVYIGGNSPIEVKKVNRKSITSTSGTNWPWDDVNPYETTKEFLQAFKDWKNSQ